MVRFPTEATAVIVLANREDLDVSDMAFRLADEALADRIDLAAPHADETLEGALKERSGSAKMASEQARWQNPPRNPRNNADSG